MAQQLLDNPQVGAMVEQMRGARVAQHMWRQLGGEADLLAVLLDGGPRRLPREPAPCSIFIAAIKGLTSAARSNASTFGRASSIERACQKAAVLRATSPLARCNSQPFHKITTPTADGHHQQQQRNGFSDTVSLIKQINPIHFNPNTSNMSYKPGFLSLKNRTARKAPWA